MSEQHRPRAPTPKGRLKNVFYGFQTASKLPTESHAMPAALNKLSFLLLLYAAVSACIFQFVLPTFPPTGRYGVPPPPFAPCTALSWHGGCGAGRMQHLLASAAA
ncbi:hypothetical protein [Neisseria bacilliformis]|uniref:hypothetical protein n=1 Tax=Neisseria bacilliformis TaxID=267212 RepID=UPI0028E55065|nr:hypothetical protein [Neisseria bacilliformis]